MSAMEWVKDVGGGHTSRGLAHPYTLGMHLTHSLALHPSPRLASGQALTAPQVLLPPGPGLLALLTVERVSSQVAAPGCQPGLLLLTCCVLGDLFYLPEEWAVDRTAQKGPKVTIKRNKTLIHATNTM